jgi:hypothetical protein
MSQVEHCLHTPRGKNACLVRQYNPSALDICRALAEAGSGFNILDGRKLTEFLERTTGDGRAAQLEDGPMHNDDERLPAHPITSGSQGVANLTQFTVDELKVLM